MSTAYPNRSPELINSDEPISLILLRLSAATVCTNLYFPVDCLR